MRYNRVKTVDNFGFSIEALLYPFLLLLVLWLIQWTQFLFPELHLVKYGVLPRDLEGAKGILFSPLLHSPRDIAHIVNNSLAIFVLCALLVFYYRDVALKVFIGLYLCSGLFLWCFAQNTGAYHIGISGLIYALLAFLFMSGVLRKYFPLQAVSLFVVFMYGSLIWGIFPWKEHVSWQGHFTGLIAGVLFAYLFKKKGAQRPKFQYEIEKDLGIEPPDLEGEYLAKIQQLQAEKAMEEARQLNQNLDKIIYHYKPKASDENDHK